MLADFALDFFAERIQLRRRYQAGDLSLFVISTGLYPLLQGANFAGNSFLGGADQSFHIIDEIGHGLVVVLVGGAGAIC